MKKLMPQMARAGKNQYGEPKPKLKCNTCGQLLMQNRFSNVDKNDSSKGKRLNCKSCCAIRAKQQREKRNNNWKYKPTLHMLNNSKQRAKKAGLEHTLLLEDIDIPDYCPVLNIKLETGDRKNKNNSPSIDRIDNTKGYTKENIMVISNKANILKKDASIDELIMIGKFYQTFKENQN